MRELQISTNKNWPEKWGLKTSIMGILNITPDSFSDGGDFFSIDNSLSHLEYLVNAGADIIDIGAQSTRPGSIEVGPEIEIKRLVPVLKRIRACYPDLIISVDTFNSDVAYQALKNGANWINDVTGGRRDNNILNVVAEFNCPFVITHSRGNSQNMNSLTKYENVVTDVVDSLNQLTESALSKNISNKNIIWDPGIGFSKDTSQNIEILKNLNEFKLSSFPILIGASRKRFIGELINEENPKKRDVASLAISALCSQLNLHVVRVHNVKIHHEFLKVSDALFR